jgi:hypothetical protein
VPLVSNLAQVIDTSKQINTWKLLHNYTRFEEVPLDTNLHQIHKEYHPAYAEGFSFESLGILGHGMNHVDFFLRPEPDAFVFGVGWDPYLKTADRTIFFNTKTPFTTLSYSTNLFINQAPEENVEAMHTQNFSPYTNFGLYFNILSGKPLYENEKTRANRVGLFGSHAKNKYSIFGTFYYNDFKAQENGGLADLDAFLAGSAPAPWEEEMQLGEAHSQYRNISFFATQKFNLVERITTTDSLGNTSTSGKTFSLSHQIHYDKHLKYYTDVIDTALLSPVYDNYYYDVTNPFDSASEDKLANVFQIILGDPDYDKLSMRAYAGHELRRFGMISPKTYTLTSFDTINNITLEEDSIAPEFHDKYFNDVYVGFHLAGPTTGIWDWVVDGKYYLLGYYQNDFRINATFSREFLQKADFGLRGSFDRRRPHYLVNQYSSSFFRWENDFSSLFRIKGEAFVKSYEMEMDLRAGVAYLNNYQYWDQQALPQVYDKDIMVMSGSFSKHFRVSGFNSEDKVLLQYTTANEVLRLPLLALYSSNYWKQSLFKGALIATVGFDVYYTTKYLASGYMPATGVFHLQNDYEVGGFPFLDVFIAFRVSRARLFVSYNNLLHGGKVVGNNYFTTYRYPMRPRNLKLGLVWTFYD